MLNKIRRQVIAISLIGGGAADLVKNKEQLIMENALLRQQVIVLQRHVARPQLTAQDRGLLVVLASRVHDWKNALQIVKPETVLRWHRAGFKLFCRYSVTRVNAHCSE